MEFIFKNCEPLCWFQIAKEVHQGYILSPCLFNLYAEYIMRNAELDEAQAGIKIDKINTASRAFSARFICCSATKYISKIFTSAQSSTPIIHRA